MKLDTHGDEMPATRTLKKPVKHASSSKDPTVAVVVSWEGLSTFEQAVNRSRYVQALYMVWGMATHAPNHAPDRLQYVGSRMPKRVSPPDFAHS